MIKSKDTRLVADETGIALFTGGKKTADIPWQEARLFIIADTAQKKMLAQPNVFELASESEILAWQGRSEIAWDDYQGVMTALTAEQYQ